MEHLDDGWQEEWREELDISDDVIQAFEADVEKALANRQGWVTYWCF